MLRIFLTHEKIIIYRNLNFSKLANDNFFKLKNDTVIIIVTIIAISDEIIVIYNYT